MPINSPGHLRTPRSQALAMGTNPAGFVEGVPYDPTAGVPVSHAGGHYVGLAPQINTATSPMNKQSPFTLSGGK